MSMTQTGSRKCLSAKLLVKAAADTDSVTEDETWTLSGWQEEPSVPESARSASAKLSKYKPAANSEPQQHNNCKSLLSNNSSSRSLNSPRVTRSNAGSPARNSSASNSPSKRRTNAGSHSGSAVSGSDSLRVKLQQQQIFGQARQRHQQRHWLGPGGEEETADDAAAVEAEHYRPPPAVIDGDAVAKFVDAAADASVAAYVMQQDHSNDNNSSSDTSRTHIQQAQPPKQPSDGDGIMQGILNRLAAVPVGTSSPSKRRALRPTLSSSGGSSFSSSAGCRAGQQSSTHPSNAPCSPTYSYSNTLVAGRFAHGLGHLGVSGNGFNSNMRQQSARSLTLGLAARAQMLLTRDLASSVTPRTPRGRMAELIGSVQPAPPAALCVDVRPGSAGGARSSSIPTGPCYPAGYAGNAAEIAALAQQQQAAARRSSLDELLHMASSKSNDVKVGRNDGISSSFRSKAGQHVSTTSSGGRGGPPTAAAAAAAAAQRSGLQMMGSRAGTRSSA